MNAEVIYTRSETSSFRWKAGLRSLTRRRPICSFPFTPTPHPSPNRKRGNVLFEFTDSKDAGCRRARKRQLAKSIFGIAGRIQKIVRKTGRIQEFAGHQTALYTLSARNIPARKTAA
jgi:hypothetical protein